MSERKRRATRALSTFEAARQTLYRPDGSPVYGDAEHQERMQEIVSELRDTLEYEIEGAREAAAEYEQEALALSYTDPTKGLATSADRERFSASLPLIREDCQTMPLPSLVAQLKAVAAGSDKVPKVLHARYATMRADAEDARLRELARNGNGSPAAVEASRLLNELRAVTVELELQTQDEDRAKRREAAEEGAQRNRRLASELRRMLSSADGTSESAREAQRAVSRI
jgi:hypothetical protein